MAGRPLWCLSLVGWPREKLPLALLGEVLAGAAEVVARAGAAIVGGHSIDDPEPKFGLVAVGEVHPDRMTTNAAAVPATVSCSQAIGTGIIATAIKQGAADAADHRGRRGQHDDAERRRRGGGRRRRCPRRDRHHGLRAARPPALDAARQRLRCELQASAVPLLPGARDLAGRDTSPAVRVATSPPSRPPPRSPTRSARWTVSCSPTPRRRRPAARGARRVAHHAPRRPRRRGTPAAAVIGTVLEGPGGTIRVTA